MHYTGYEFKKINPDLTHKTIGRYVEYVLKESEENITKIIISWKKRLFLIKM